MNSTELAGCSIRKYFGASSDLPVFRSNERKIWGDTPRYRFDTYGKIPRNIEKWDARHLGAGGAFGATDVLQDVVDAIRALNQEGIVAPICETFFEEAVSRGAIVV